MAFGIVRLYSSLEPQKLIDVTNEHLDKNNRKKRLYWKIYNPTQYFHSRL